MGCEWLIAHGWSFKTSKLGLSYIRSGSSHRIKERKLLIVSSLIFEFLLENQTNIGSKQLTANQKNRRNSISYILPNPNESTDPNQSSSTTTTTSSSSSSTSTLNRSKGRHQHGTSNHNTSNEQKNEHQNQSFNHVHFDEFANSPQTAIH